jgi:hypothetical protein
MFLFRTLLLLGLLAETAGFAQTPEAEHNLWPIRVAQQNARGATESWEAAGPIVFRKPVSDGAVSTGVRPFYVQTRSREGYISQALFTYPLFTYESDAENFRWRIFEIIKRSGRKASAPPLKGSFSAEREIFEVWPFWFSRQDPLEPNAGYRALFPIAGTLKNRFGYQRLSWTLFPLYVRSEKRDVITTQTPWPIVRFTHGASRGFAIWPLFGWKNGPGELRERFFLWPLGYNNYIRPLSSAPDDSPPTRQIGAIPFYTRNQGYGYINENYLWPFFGYTDRTVPRRYHETRYFWPLLVQTRGDDYRNRWAPFYTHSIVHGFDKTWVGWPIYRQARWTDDGIIQTKRRVLMFLYYSLDQQSARNPTLPHAYKTHFWPLYSRWDNGAGHRQLQVFSPFEVFFLNNEKVRQVWTPLAAIYRYDQPAPGYSRHSFLWNAVTMRRTPERSEFHLGPLFSVARNSEQKRVALVNGLLSFRRDAGSNGWHISWLDFSSKRDATVSSAR